MVGVFYIYWGPNHCFSLRQWESTEPTLYCYMLHMQLFKSIQWTKNLLKQEEWL